MFCRLILLPAAENQLCLFVSSLADQKLCHSTIKSFLAAIRHLHIAPGFGDPHINCMAKLEQVLKVCTVQRASEESHPSPYLTYPFTENEGRNVTCV